MNQLLPQCARMTTFLFCLLLLLAGCGGVGYQSMDTRVSLVDIQVLEMRPMETTFQVELRVLNPEETTLIVQGISGDLSIDGRHFASGLTGEQYEIPAYDTATISMPVYASTFDMVTSILQYARQTPDPEEQIAPIRYELSGHVRVRHKNSESTRTIPFASKGELNLQGPQK